ncbi:MAG: DUF488 family protein [Dehalococcoidia bacterium]|nr:DUF488 family protein [Dehalococcoidia bacterium]
MDEARIAMLKVRRVYDPPDSEDGVRILADRLWPRGLKKEDARLDGWRKDLAPSDGLRQWFGHEPEKWEEFKSRYRRELAEAGKDQELRALAARSATETVTILYGSKERRYNNAVALREFIESARMEAS